MIPLIGGTVTAGARRAGHTMSLALTGAVMVGVIFFLLRERKKRPGTGWELNGPLILSALGGVLMLLDPLRHVLQDQGVVDMPQYRHGCETEDMKCLSVYGWLLTVVFTYSGIGLLVFGTMWNADLLGKLEEIRDKWNEIRAEHEAEEDEQDII